MSPPAACTIEQQRIIAPDFPDRNPHAFLIPRNPPWDYPPASLQTPGRSTSTPRTHFWRETCSINKIPNPSAGNKGGNYRQKQHSFLETKARGNERMREEIKKKKLMNSCKPYQKNYPSHPFDRHEKWKLDREKSNPTHDARTRTHYSPPTAAAFTRNVS